MLTTRVYKSILSHILSRGFVSVTFHSPNGESRIVSASSGETILQIAQHHNISLEGACEGGIACATCHVIVGDKYFTKLPEASEAEEDCLDNASDITETSRLGCQLRVTEDLDGIDITIPKSTRNFYIDGYVPKPHFIVFCQQT